MKDHVTYSKNIRIENCYILKNISKYYCFMVFLDNNNKKKIILKKSVTRDVKLVHCKKSVKGTVIVLYKNI